MIVKGHTRQKEGRLSVPEHIRAEEEGQSSLAIASMLCGMSQEKTFGSR